MFRIKQLHVDTLSERVIFIHERAVREGQLGFKPLDRVRVESMEPVDGKLQKVTGIVNFCSNDLVSSQEIGLSNVAFRDLGLLPGAWVRASLAPAPTTVDLVRAKLRGERLDYEALRAILEDVTHHRYSKVELTMFVLACALRELDAEELVALTRAMIDTGRSLDFGAGPIVDKHCIGGVPGNRTTMVVVPILTSMGLVVPKTSSRAITSPSGTADTMDVLAEVALSPERLREVVAEAGGFIAWGGALDLAPADDILITVERPMEIDTEPQMVASILAKKVTAGATHALIDIPVGETAKIRTREDAERLCELFRVVARKIGLTLDLVVTEARGPIGHGIGPRLEALDVLSVLRLDPAASESLREKSLYLAGRISEMAGIARAGGGYRAAQEILDSGEAERAFDRIVAAQGARTMPPEAPFHATMPATSDGRIRSIDCWQIARVAKQAGAPANPAAGVRLLRSIGDVVRTGEPLYEIHSQSSAQLEGAREFAEAAEQMVRFGF